MFDKLRRKLLPSRSKGRANYKTGESSRPANLAQQQGQISSESGKDPQPDPPLSTTPPLTPSPPKTVTQQEPKIHCEPQVNQDDTEFCKTPVIGSTSKEDDTQPRDSKTDLKDEQSMEGMKEDPLKRMLADSGATDENGDDLWQRAFDELDDDSKRRLQETPSKSPTAAIDDVIKETKEKFQECQDNGLSFKIYKGEKIDVRDVATRILNSAIQCADIVKGALAFDPSGHASSAWTIVSLGLTMVRNSVDQKEAFFKSSEFLADTLARYTILDHFCRIKKLPSSNAYDDAIVQLYKALLVYTCHVRKLQSTGKLDRIWSSMVSASDSELSHLESSVKEQDQKVISWSMIHFDLGQRKEAANIIRGIESVRAQHTAHERREFLTWLSDISYEKAQNDNQMTRIEDTGEWLLNSAEYRDWKATPGKSLWLHGPAGWGKSILCSTIIQDIKKNCNSDSSAVFAYWYFSFNNDKTQNVQEMTRSIIRQLIPKDLPESLVRLWKDHSEHKREPEYSQFSVALEEMINSHPAEHVFIIFDAIDECPENGLYARNLLFQLLKGLMKACGPKIHILATSRFEEGIRCHLQDSVRVDIEERMNDDVRTLVDDALDQRLRKWAKLKDEIQKALFDPGRSKGFRWTELQILRLQRCKKEDNVTKLLKSVPETLEELYHGLLDAINEDERAEARSILNWLSFSLEPLKLEIVAAAVGYPDPEDVVKTCTTSFVTVSPSDGTIELAHFSVKEFLVVSNLKQPRLWYQLTERDGHEELAHHTLDGLIKQTRVLSQELADAQPILTYAASHWNGHFSKFARFGKRSPELEEKVDLLFNAPIVYSNWQHISERDFCQFYWRTKSNSYKPTPPFALACEMELLSVISRLFPAGANPYTFCDHWALGKDVDLFDLLVYNNQLETLKWLLEMMVVPPRKVEVILKSINLTELSIEEVQAILDILLKSYTLWEKPFNGRHTLQEDFLIAVTRNSSGPRLMQLLLEMQDTLVIPITQRILVEIARNPDSAEETMRIIPKHRYSDIQITQDFMETVAKVSGTELGYISLLLETFRDQILLNDKVIMNFLQHARVEVVELLLQSYHDEIEIPETLLIAVVSHWKGFERLCWLLERFPNFEFTSNVIEAVMCNEVWSRLASLKVLLQQCPKGLHLEDKLLADLIGEAREEPALLDILLQKRENGFIILDLSDNLFTAVASTCSKETIELLISSVNRPFSVTEELLCSAAGNEIHGKSVMTSLFAINPTLHVSENILISAVRNSKQGHSIFTYLVGLGQEVSITEKLLLSAASNLGQGAQLLEFIFSSFPHSVVTGSVLDAATLDTIPILLNQKRSEKSDYSRCLTAEFSKRSWLMGYALEQGLLEADDDLVNAMGIERLLSLALRNLSLMTKLLNMQSDDMSITEDVILEELDGFPVDYQAFRLLINWLSLQTLVTERFLVVALVRRQSELFEGVLKDGGHWSLEGIWELVWQDESALFEDKLWSASQLLQHGEFDISKALQEAFPVFLESNECQWESEEIFQHLMGLCNQRNLSTVALEMITEYIFGSGDLEELHELFVHLVNSGTPISQKNWDELWANQNLDMNQKMEISQVLLEFGKFEISGALLQFILQKEDAGFSDEELKGLIHLCSGREISFALNEKITDLVLSLGDTDTIQVLLILNPGIQPTNDVFRLLEGNRWADKELLAPFLHLMGDTDQIIEADDEETITDVADELKPVKKIFIHAWAQARRPVCS